jgi:hypothetical protein
MLDTKFHACRQLQARFWCLYIEMFTFLDSGQEDKRLWTQ